MSNLSSRLRRLEVIDGGCPTCGSGSAPVEYTVEWDHEEADNAEPERCPECGAQLVFVVRWGDAPVD